MATMSRKVLFRCATAGLVLMPLASRAEEPVLRIATQGSMEAGGKTIDCATNDGGDPKSTRWPSGHVAVDNSRRRTNTPRASAIPYGQNNDPWVLSVQCKH